MTDRIDFEKLIARQGSCNWDRSPPSAPGQVAKLQASLPFALPREYVEFLLFSNGAYGKIPVRPSWCIIFPAQEILERNVGNEVPEYLPGYLAIGSSGGSDLLLFKTDGEIWPVYSFSLPWAVEKGGLLVAANFLELVCMLGKQSDDDEDEGVN